MRIILKNKYPSGLDYRKQVRTLASEIAILPEDEPLVVDVSDACLSRSAMDEFYKTFVSDKSPFANRCTVINEDEDFTLKLKAVKRSQNVRKHLRTFSQEQIITVTTADKMAEVARLFS